MGKHGLFKCFISYALCASLIFALPAFTFAAEHPPSVISYISDYKDAGSSPGDAAAFFYGAEYAGHWARSAVETCLNYGIIDGKKHSGLDDPLTRAEFIAMVNRAFGYGAPNILLSDEYDYYDVSPDAWYAGDMRAAAALGIVVGYGNGVAAPSDAVTREQAAVILHKVLRLEASHDAADTFTDINDASSWAVPAVASLGRNGYAAGVNGAFLPKKQITLGEAAQLIVKVSGSIIVSNLDARLSEFNNITVTKPGVTLKNARIGGDVFLTEGVGDGEVDLVNLRIAGRLVIAGGGGNTVRLKNVAADGGILVEKPAAAGGQPVRLFIERSGRSVTVSKGHINEIIIDDDLNILVENDGGKVMLNISEPHDSEDDPSIILYGNATVGAITAYRPVAVNGAGAAGKLVVHTDEPAAVKHKAVAGAGTAVLTIIDNKSVYEPEPELETDKLPPYNPPSEPVYRTGSTSSHAPKTTPAPVSTPAPAPTPTLGGIAVIAGDNKIGRTLTIDANGISGGEPPYIYRWAADGHFIDGAVGDAYTITGADAGKTISCAVGHAVAAGEITAVAPDAVPFNVGLGVFGAAEGDVAELTADSGAPGAEIKINYMLADVADNNALYFYGINAGIAPITEPGGGFIVYTVDAADAQNGVIVINAVFEHTDLTPDPISFTDASARITLAYGDAFANPVADKHAGTGAVIYLSDDETVATVGLNGAVQTHATGTATITAVKAADAIYAGAARSYALHVVPKDISITGVRADDRQYDGTFGVTLTGGTLLGVLAADDVDFNLNAGLMANADASETLQTVRTEISLTGADAAKYNLIQPHVTARITPKELTVGISGPIYANGGDADSYGALTPLYADGRDEREAVITVTIGGFVTDADAGGVTPEIQRADNVLTLDGHDMPVELENGVLTYDIKVEYGFGQAFENDYTQIQITVLNLTDTPNYIYNGGIKTLKVNIRDGQSPERAVPITQSNIRAFNIYMTDAATNTAGLKMHYTLAESVKWDSDNSGYNWKPIGSLDNKFTGSFDGRGNEIDGLNISSGGDYQGMFAYIGTGSVVKNLGLININVKGNKNVGGISGGNAGTITHCYVEGSVHGVEHIGGIVGYLYSDHGIVNNCYTIGNIQGESFTGGITGRNDGKINNCYSIAIVYGKTERTGGIVGQNTGSGVIQNCVALNEFVVTTMVDNFIGRITGLNLYERNLINNYAYINMDIRHSKTESFEGEIKIVSSGVKTKDGANIDSTHYYNVSWWTDVALWSADIWQFNDDAYPTLKNMPNSKIPPTDIIPATTLFSGSYITVPDTSTTGGALTIAKDNETDNGTPETPDPTIDGSHPGKEPEPAVLPGENENESDPSNGNEEESDLDGKNGIGLDPADDN